MGLLDLIPVALVVWIWKRKSDERGSQSSGELPGQQSSPFDVPSSFDLTDPFHVALLDEIRSAYGDHLSDGLGAYDGCVFRPASGLPYSKGDIETALAALLDFVEGRRESPLLDAAIRQPEAADNIKTALFFLDDFIDVPPEQLPTETNANLQVGFRGAGRTTSP
jgi:hypothetical protein